MPATGLVIISASLAGALLGCLSGLVPGIHANNMASSLAGRPGLLLLLVSMGSVAVEDPTWVLAASVAVVACAVAHTVANIVPSIFLAVPDEDTALSVLPGHRMAKAGRGLEALRISVFSSMAALTISLVILVPVRSLMTDPGNLYSMARPWLAPSLIGVSAMMVMREVSKPNRPERPGGLHAGLASVVIFMVSGVIGSHALGSPGLVGPLFIGLFGVPTVLMAMTSAQPGSLIPQPEGDGRTKGMPWRSVVLGTMAGTVVGWFPGVSSAQATVMIVPKEVGGEDPELEGARRFIAGVSAVNTANALFNLAALATLLRVRSGTMAAVAGLNEWSSPPWSEGFLPGLEVTVLVGAAAIGGLVAAPVTLWLGGLVARAARGLSGPWALTALLAILLIAALVRGGEDTLLVLVVASAIGMLPPLLGIMRVHLMGAVTLPLVIGLMSG
jgi:putative membrane protein